MCLSSLHSLRTFIALLLLVFWHDDGFSQRKEHHPMPERIPHFGASHISIPGTANLQDPFYNKVLRNAPELTKQSVDILISDLRGIEVASLSESRILILDKTQNTLTEFDLKTGEKAAIAGAGRGPGDLFFAMDMTAQGKNVYVSMGGFRITHFDCSVQPCKVAGTIPLEKANLLSFARHGNDFVGLRAVPIMSAAPEVLEDAATAAIALMDSNGKIKAEFGKPYAFGTHMMLMDAFKNGYVRHLSSVGQTALAFEALPILYLYDDERKLSKTYKLDVFTLMKYEYDTATGALAIPEGAYSMITRMDRAGDNGLILEVMHRKPGANGSDSDRFEWFWIDVAAGNSARIGTVDQSDIRIRFASHGALIFQDEDVFWVSR